MQFIDTHTHIYLPEFDCDRDETVSRAISANVEKMLLPNINNRSVEVMLNMVGDYPGICFAMIGLHPTSVGKDYKQQIKNLFDKKEGNRFIAVGEIGVDLYWDRAFLKEQLIAFEDQLNIAMQLDLPVVIHCRDSFDEIFSVLEQETFADLKGVFHAFTGNLQQARRVIDMGFLLGIGGIVTFRNAGLDSVVEEVGPGRIILETDSPYLAPVPNRGKRNEPANIKYIAARVAEITGKPVEEIAEVTTANAVKLFRLKITGDDE